MAEGTHPGFHHALAGELDAVKAALEAAAVALCLDPAVFARHAEPLQCFDRLAQTIAEVATLLRNPAALPDIRLEALRDRLTPTDQAA